MINEKGEKELVTAPTTELTLPGVVRDSVIVTNLVERGFYN